MILYSLRAYALPYKDRHTAKAVALVFFVDKVIQTPYKSKRPCSWPGCPELVTGRFCEKHSKEYARQYDTNARDPVSTKRYNARWEKIRATYIHAHPICAECERAGRMTPAELVHHIKPLKDGGTHAAENLMSLCNACHSRLHARDGSRWRKKN